MVRIIDISMMTLHKVITIACHGKIIWHTMSHDNVRFE